jgi:hypothetical protein
MLPKTIEVLYLMVLRRNSKGPGSVVGLGVGVERKRVRTQTRGLKPKKKEDQGRQ